MKRLVLITAVITFGLFLLTGPASASSISDFAAIYMTDASGSTTPKTSFAWNETPWLYVKLTSSLLNLTSSWWFDPSDNPQSLTKNRGANNEFWQSPTNWGLIKTDGEWTVNSSAFFYNGNENLGSAKFRVNLVPEPVSSALFLLGGIGLAGVKIYKSKRRSVR